MPLTATSIQARQQSPLLPARCYAPTVAVLFAREDSIYKQIPGCDVWDKSRNALKWPGGNTVIAHPPCRAWGQLRHQAKPEPGEKELALFAVKAVQQNGGVLEHPARSTLWEAARLPKNGERDMHGGWTMTVPQFWWGHNAFKSTNLYIVGCSPCDVPPVPLKLGEAPCVLSYSHQCRTRPETKRAEREATPLNFALWLVETARRCKGHNDKLSHGDGKQSPTANETTK